MNKTAIKNYAIWARNKLIADITYKASLMGITADGIKKPLPQSAAGTQLYDIGTKDPYAITGKEIHQRNRLVNLINQKAALSDYKTAYQSVIEEVAYTWFNRLIAIRFMEVNDYLPSHIRVLSSDSPDKLEPDIVTDPFDTDLEFTSTEESRIIALKNENKVDDLFQLLFIKQCNALNECLPMLFEKTEDYTELLLNVSVTDHGGVVYHLIHDIPEDNFNVNALDEEGKPIGQVEIIGWLYQYYNTEPKDAAFAKKGKITKEEIPAVTQLFTPDWIVRYMVENSVGRIWIEHLRANDPSVDEKAIAERFGWKYYLPEAKQDPDVQAKLDEIYATRKDLKPEDITCLDPAMGSGHILVYMFEVLMQIYKSAGYAERDAAISILEHNIYGLDIDDRAFQLSYFALIMKARQYSRTILRKKQNVHVYAIQESNSINRAQLTYFGSGFDNNKKDKCLKIINQLLDTFSNAKEYGSFINVKQFNKEALTEYIKNGSIVGQLSFEGIGIEETQRKLEIIIQIAEVLSRHYMVVITNPPYMPTSNADSLISSYVKDNYVDGKEDFYSAFALRSIGLANKEGYIALVTSYTWMYLKKFEVFRRYILNNVGITSLVQPEYHSFFEEANVPLCTFVLLNSPIKLSGVYVNLKQFTGAENQGRMFLKAVETDGCDYRYYFDQRQYYEIPGMPIAYWISNNILRAFKKDQPLGKVAEPRQGLATTNNDKYLRLWFEVNRTRILFNAGNKKEAKESGSKWFPYNKGGDFRRWFGNNYYIVNYSQDGLEIKKDVLQKYPYLKTPDFVVKNTDYYFHEGFTWTTLTIGAFSGRYLTKGQVFDTKGSSCFTNNHTLLLQLLAFVNSNVAGVFLQVVSPTIDYNVGSIAKLPIAESINQLNTEDIKECIKIAKDDWDSFELSWDFSKHPLVLLNDKSHKLIENAYKEWTHQCISRFNALKAVEERINRQIIEIYHMEKEVSEIIPDRYISVNKSNITREIHSLISYFVGCMFGRYSLDVDGLAYAGGNWDASKYSTFIPDEDNVIPITDEEYFDDDIVGLFIAWLKKVYGEDTLEENLSFIAKALGGKGRTSREVIRNYFLNDFFKDHCQTYSVTGSGKRPIYWLFSSGKQNGFKALIYMHRYNPDTIGKVRVDYLHRMEQIYTNEITRMQDVVDHSNSAHDVSVAEKRIEKLRKQVKECQDYDAKLGHLALDRIAIDLDDGVKINYRKVQTGSDGKFYEVLADSKQIMAKDELWKQYLTEWHK